MNSASCRKTIFWLISGLIVLLGAFIGMNRFFLRHNKGFCIGQIYSSQPVKGSWDAKSSSIASSEELKEIFSQPFSYLGKGHQSVVFESEDKKYVLKFYKFPSHMKTGGWMAEPLSRFTDKRKAIRCYNENKFIETKASHLLAFTDFQEESGLIAVQMNKTNNCPYIVSLKDPLLHPYQVALKDTFFVLQKKGELIFPTLTTLVKEGKIDEVKAIIDNVLSFVIQRSFKGIKDEDAILEKNYGLLRSHLFQLDTGRLKINSSMKNQEDAKNEALKVTEPLKNWLSNVSPELLQYYLSSVEKI